MWHAKEDFTIVHMDLMQLLTSAGGHAAVVRPVYTVFASGGVGMRQGTCVTPPGCEPMES